MHIFRNIRNSWLYASYFYIYTLFVCLFFLIQKTSERLIRSSPIFLWNLKPHLTRGRFMDDRIFKNLPQIKIDFWKFWKSTKFFDKIQEIFVWFCFTMHSKRQCSQFKKKMGAKRPKTLVNYKYTNFSHSQPKKGLRILLKNIYANYKV